VFVLQKEGVLFINATILQTISAFLSKTLPNNNHLFQKIFKKLIYELTLASIMQS